METAVIRRCVAAAAVCLVSLPALGQHYPAKAIKLIVPYTAGGIADTFSRALTQQLSESLKQPVLVDNKPGGSTIIGAEAVAKSPPDGYTLFLGSISSLAINVGMFKKLPYDPIKDFSPISLAFYTPLFLVVNPKIPAATVRELVNYAKANPGAVNFGSVGYGSSIHLAGELFKVTAGINIVHVPYKGSSQVLPDLVGGRVQMVFDGGTFLSQVKSGALRLLAVTSSKRLESAPDAPTMAEAGMPGYEMEIWFGVVGPAGTPKPIVDRLAREMADINRQPAFKKRFADSGVELVSNTPEAFAELIASDMRKWVRLVNDAGLQAQ